jgi:hypothetical protein
VVDGVWVEKLRANTSIGRNPADKYTGADVDALLRELDAARERATT